MTNPSTGRFCWHELVTSGLAIATKFFEEFRLDVQRYPESAGRHVPNVLARREAGGRRDSSA
jgi:hypothetical protein